MIFFVQVPTHPHRGLARPPLPADGGDRLPALQPAHLRASNHQDVELVHGAAPASTGQADPGDLYAGRREYLRQRRVVSQEV